MNMPENILVEMRGNTKKFKNYLNMLEYAHMNRKDYPDSFLNIFITIILFILIIIKIFIYKNSIKKFRRTILQ